jgi:Fur family peroxide stress response transcriptional regulator
MLRKKCKEANLKITHQRSVIYDALHNDRTHPSADDVYRKVRQLIPSISYDTVNRTLLSFVRIGLLKVVEGYGRPKRFEPNAEQHHHFQCLRCNTIVDIYDPELDTVKIPVSIAGKFMVTGKKVVVEGLCDKCKKQGSRKKEGR